MVWILRAAEEQRNAIMMDRSGAVEAVMLLITTDVHLKGKGMVEDGCHNIIIKVVPVTST